MTVDEQAVKQHHLLSRIRRASVKLAHGHAERDYCIRLAVDAGVTTRTIADAAGLSFSQVARIAKAKR